MSWVLLVLPIYWIGPVYSQRIRVQNLRKIAMHGHQVLMWFWKEPLVIYLAAIIRRNFVLLCFLHFSFPEELNCRGED